jgi:hypothetical protein
MTPSPSQLLRKKVAAEVPRPVVLMAIAVLLGLQLIPAGYLAYRMFTAGAPGIDFTVLTEAGTRIAHGLDPYTNVHGALFRWHPLAAWFFYLVGFGGPWVWRAAQLASLALLRDWRLIALALTSWPLWDAMFAANATLLVVTVGFAALSGSRWVSIIYLTMCALIPRPWMAPTALWLIWKRPDLRWPAVVIAMLGVGSAVAMGWADEWVGVLLTTGTELANPNNWSPTRIFGLAWLIVGLPLGAWLTWKGRIGLAGLVIAPYAFTHYYLALLWEGRRSVDNLREERPANIRSSNPRADVLDLEPEAR